MTTTTKRFTDDVGNVVVARTDCPGSLHSGHIGGTTEKGGGIHWITDVSRVDAFAALCRKALLWLEREVRENEA